MAQYKDYYRGLIYNEQDDLSFAVEPEVSHRFRKRLDYDDFKHESDNIIEYLGVHEESEETRLYIHDTIQEHYSDRFPVGEDGYLSGGVHFVLFGDYSEFKHKYKELKYKILNCPLHLKINDVGSKMYGRRMSNRCNFGGQTELPTGSKGDFCCLKSELYSNGHQQVEGVPIEFRCNNVFDERLLGYYQGIMLCVEKDVIFKRTSPQLRDYSKRGETDYYGGNGDYELFELQGHEISPDDMKVLRHNIRKILKALKEEGLLSSAKKFKEYCNEYGIKYI